MQKLVLGFCCVSQWKNAACCASQQHIIGKDWESNFRRWSDNRWWENTLLAFDKIFSSLSLYFYSYGREFVDTFTFTEGNKAIWSDNRWWENMLLYLARYSFFHLHYCASLTFTFNISFYFNFHFFLSLSPLSLLSLFTSSSK